MTDSVDWADDIKDRGEAKYFHGRKKILARFRKRLQFAVDDAKEGTTFLIQAAPGAGKTALLAECARLAKKQNWDTVEVDTRALWNTDSMCLALEDGWMPLLDEIASEGGFDKWIHVRGSVKFKLPGHTPQSIIARGKAPLLLILDEAQELGQWKGAERTQENHELVQTFLNRVHNGKLASRPVMLIAGGLGTTKQAFKDMGVSRLKTNCHVDLEPLKPEEERKVIVDWLQLEGKAKGDPLPWINAIAAETHGWPQHIACYAQVAALQVLADRRRMTPSGLNVVMEAGRKERAKFYEARVEDFEDDELHYIARMLRDVPPRHSFTKQYLIDALKGTYGVAKAERLFQRALHKGILDKRSNQYMIPIPSMHDWLVTHFGHDQGVSPIFMPLSSGPRLSPERPLDTYYPSKESDHKR